MRRSVIYILWMLILLSAVTGGLSDSVSSLSVSNPHDLYILNSLLPPPVEHDHTVVATLDGTIYLVDVTAKKLLWSFPTGRPIYSSYQANETDKHDISEVNSNFFYYDVGDDWELYVHNGPLSKMKLPISIEEYIRKVPFISDDGGVTLGAKNSTVYVTDAESGKLVHSYRLDDTSSAFGIRNAGKNSLLLVEEADLLLDNGVQDIKNLKHLLYIIRKDYVLQHKSPTTGKILWNLAFSEIEAEFHCQGNKKSSGLGSLNLENQFGADYRSHIESQLPCQKKAVVYRIRDNRFLEHPALGRLGYTGPGGCRSLPHVSYDKPALAADGEYPLALRNSEGNLMPRDEGALVLYNEGTLNKKDEKLMLDHKRRPKEINEEHYDKGTLMVPFPNFGYERSEMVNGHSHNAGTTDITSRFDEFISSLRGFPYISFLVTLISIMGGFLYRMLSIKKQDKLSKKTEETNSQPKMLRKKKTRRSVTNRNGAKNEGHQIYASPENKFEGSKGLPFISDMDSHVDGRKIGKLFVSNKEIAKGSNGTVVLEGIYDGRPVAVKRLVRTHHDVALKEIQNLIVSDQHPNIVRWYGVEHDQDFVYLSLERCSCSLSDLIFVHSKPLQGQINTKDTGSYFPNEYSVRLLSPMQNDKSVELWKANGYPTIHLLKLMRDIVSGLAHLHELGIIHRDLKPQNVLILKEKMLCAKISDMGISKRLPEDMSSLTLHQTGYGSSGWQAPEQLQHGRQTRAVDLFSLGCVLFFCVTGGKHPYGDNIERDINILNNHKDLFLIEHMPEAMDLFSSLLDPDPNSRPKASDVLLHPFFWNSETRLSFLRDVSDRVELEDREKESELLTALESIGTLAFSGKWDERMETAFLNNIGSYRRYKFDSVRDLLRVIRNKLNHYRELPSDIQELLGPVPGGFDGYFSSRFPHLLIEVYNVMYRYCKQEEFLQKYIRSNPL